MSNKVRLIGLDPGASAVRASEVRDGSIVTSIVPSVVGVGSMNVGALNLAGVGRNRKGVQPDRVRFDGVEYLVGEGVSDYAKPIERIDFERFTDGPELRALFYRAWVGLAPEPGTRGDRMIALAIGVPVEVLENAEQAAEMERGMKKWMIGRHHFELNDVAYRFAVTNLKAKVAQPVGTWLNWGMDYQAKWTRGKDAFLAPTVIVDQGFSTLDIFAVSNGQISRRNTDGATLGMRRACEMVSESINRRYRVEVGLHQADELILAVGSGRKALTWVEGKHTDVSAEVNQALNAIAAEVLRFVNRTIDGARSFKVLITGGGALTLGDRLVRSMPHAEVMVEPRLSNVMGLAKLAQKQGYL